MLIVTKMKKDIYKKTVQIPEKVEFKVDDNILTIKGPLGEVKRIVSYPNIGNKIENNEFNLYSVKGSKKQTKIINTYIAHIKNSVRGVTEGHHYELKICSSHFPMNVSFSNNELTIKNFIGEKHPRKLSIKPQVKLKVEGDKIKLDSYELEVVSQTAADIERLTRRLGFDDRVFQDGCYITIKDGKEIK